MLANALATAAPPWRASWPASVAVGGGAFFAALPGRPPRRSGGRLVRLLVGMLRRRHPGLGSLLLAARGGGFGFPNRLGERRCDHRRRLCFLMWTFFEVVAIESTMRYKYFYPKRCKKVTYFEVVVIGTYLLHQ